MQIAVVAQRFWILGSVAVAIDAGGARLPVSSAAPTRGADAPQSSVAHEPLIRRDRSKVQRTLVPPTLTH